MPNYVFYIERVVNALGKQKAIYIYQRTKQAEQNGGILTLVSE